MTWIAFVELIDPEGFADGAATGPSNSFRSLRATGWDGTRKATVSKPAVISFDRFALALIGATIVSGPGQNLFARRSESSSKIANFCAVSRFKT